MDKVEVKVTWGLAWGLFWRWFLISLAIYFVFWLIVIVALGVTFSTLW